jgi:hypothetical protein
MTNHNVAVGYKALHSNTTGSRNTALGYQALYKRPEPEPLTEWYKAAVKAKGLTPHIKEQDAT